MLGKRLLGVAAATAMTVTAWSAQAQSDYPSRPITMIVAYSAGGSTDIAARMIAGYLETYLGGNARIAVVNRPGAGGEIGFTAIAQANPDGYTIGFLNVPGVINPMIERSPAYTLDSFTPLANLVSDPASIVVNKNSRMETLQDWLEAVKATPNAITVGNPALGGVMHTSVMRFLHMAGNRDGVEYKVTDVPFPGSAPSRNALMGGHITSSVMGLVDAGPFHKEGEIRVLGTMASSRHPLLPDVPTFRELGYDLVAASHRGLAAPAGIPDEIRARLIEAIRKTVEDPDFIKQMHDQFMPIDFVPGDDYGAMLESIHADMKELWEVMPWRR
jgi:tripartite-type tricarboxylate transporter receptor subunit TctC